MFYLFVCQKKGDGYGYLFVFVRRRGDATVVIVIPRIHS